jgi:hypothetical protein
MGSFKAHPAEEMPSDVRIPGARPSHELFIHSLPSAELEGYDIADQDGMVIVISWRDSFSN